MKTKVDKVMVILAVLIVIALLANVLRFNGVIEVKLPDYLETVSNSDTTLTKSLTVGSPQNQSGQLEAEIIQRTNKYCLAWNSSLYGMQCCQTCRSQNKSFQYQVDNQKKWCNCIAKR